jgi:hypothetical protein
LLVALQPIKNVTEERVARAMEDEGNEGEVLERAEEGGSDGKLGGDDGEALERVKADQSGVDVALLKVIRVSQPGREEV